jgi:hypothetical protein
MRRLTVNGGIRYEHNHTTLVGLDEALVEFGSWSPRLGVAFEINEKTVVKTSVSRLGEKFALDFLFTFFPNPIVYDTATSSLGNGVLDVFTQGAAPLTTTRNVDRRVPSALEFVTSLARQLPWGIAADVSYVRRRYKGFTDSIDRNLILDIPNKRFVGRVNPAFDALTDVVTNARQQRLYNSLQFWINRRLANRWQVDAAYTYAIDRQDGEFGFGTTALAALQFAYGDRARDFYGVTSGPRHTLKLAGSYTLPWDVTAGVYYSKKSPTVLLDQYQVLPATALPPRVTLSNGRIVNDPLFNPLLLVAPPDEEVGRKIGGQHLLSLQLEKSFLIGRHTLRVMALGYNLPNASRALNYLSSTIGNTNYGRFSSIQPPRAGQLSFGWEF